MASNFIVEALSPMRRAIATRMSEAQRTIPHFRLVADIRVDKLLALRRELREGSTERKLSLNDLIIKGTALALVRTPAINIQLVGDEIHRYSVVDISVVTIARGGLVTPVVRGADHKSVWEIAEELKAMIERADQNKLRMSDIVGGSFSISNLGMHGVEQFDAIINAPQCAILAIGCARPRQVVSSSVGCTTEMVVRTTLSIDHRALDGVIGAQFLSALRESLENPRELMGNL